MGGRGDTGGAHRGCHRPSVRPAERISRFLAEQRLPLSLVGASYAGVSVNDCIASAKAAVEQLLGG